MKIFIYFAIQYFTLCGIYSAFISWKYVKSLGISIWALGEFLITFFLISTCPIMGIIYPLWNKLYQIRRNMLEAEK